MVRCMLGKALILVNVENNILRGVLSVMLGHWLVQDSTMQCEMMAFEISVFKCWKNVKKRILTCVKKRELRIIKAMRSAIIKKHKT